MKKKELIPVLFVISILIIIVILTVKVVVDAKRSIDELNHKVKMCEEDIEGCDYNLCMANAYKGWKSETTHLLRYQICKEYEIK